MSDFDVSSTAHTVALWQNMSTPAGPVNMLAGYAQCHFDMLSACVAIYTSAWMMQAPCNQSVNLAGKNANGPFDPLDEKSMSHQGL